MGEIIVTMGRMGKQMWWMGSGVGCWVWVGKTEVGV